MQAVGLDGVGRERKQFWVKGKRKNAGYFLQDVRTCESGDCCA